jgi:hypothetical protein
MENAKTASVYAISDTKEKLVKKNTVMTIAPDMATASKINVTATKAGSEYLVKKLLVPMTALTMVFALKESASVGKDLLVIHV